MPKIKSLRTRKIEELNWQEFREIVPKVTDAVILPVGTLEAHGITGLGTDNQIPVSIAERIAGKVNALIAPTIPYGITRSLLPYPGSVTVTSETFERYVYEAACGLGDAGLRRIVFLNGHGGNTEALKNLSPRLYKEKKVYNLVIDWWTHCPEEVRQVYGHAGGHAATDETALVMADHPEQVRKERYRKDMAYFSQPGLVATPFPGAIILYEKDEGYPDFDPAKAQKLMEVISKKVEQTVMDVFKRWDKIRKA
jgi:creatinine amidohydrolase